MVMRMTMEGTRAPQLVGESERWLNTDGRALALGTGVLYLVDFWDYTCVNCLRALPYVKEWHERYRHWDFVVIGVHTPEFEFAKSRENVEAAVRRLGINYPVLLDSDRTNWDNYTNRYWPRHYLVNGSKQIVHDHIGEGGYAETEAAVQREIHRIHPEAVLPEIMEPVRAEDAQGAVCYPVTPETYAGYNRGRLGNSEGYQPNAPHAYIDPGHHVDGLIYLRGTWKAAPESLVHARETATAEDYLAIHYHALELNAVMKPEHDARYFDAFVLQDGKPLALDDKGEDVKYTDDGQAYVHVEDARMYKIVRNARFGSHELRLCSASDAFGIYAFTFGSCQEPD